MTLSLREPSPSLHLEREQTSEGRNPPYRRHEKWGSHRQVSTHKDTVLGNDHLTLKMLKMPVDFLNTSDLTKSSSCARVSSRWVMAQIPKQQARPWGGTRVCSHLGTVVHLPTRYVGRSVYPHTYTKYHAQINLKAHRIHMDIRVEASGVPRVQACTYMLTAHVASSEQQMSMA